MPGCHAVGELCLTDGDYCEGLCTQDPQNTPGVPTCQNNRPWNYCQGPGEPCEGTENCCDDQEGFDCKACTSDAECQEAHSACWSCVNGRSEYKACRPTITGLLRCVPDTPELLPTGASCSLPDQCRSRVCAEDPAASAFVCLEACIRDATASCAADADCAAGLVCAGVPVLGSGACQAARCTAGSDCCSGYCFLGVCQPPPEQCKPLAAACTSDAEWCQGVCDGTCRMP